MTTVFLTSRFGGYSLTRSGHGAVPPQERRHEGVVFRGIFSHARERPFGAVTPLERRDED